MTSPPAEPAGDGLHAVLECLGVAAFVMDMLGDGWARIAAANDRFLDAVGVGRDRVIGLSLPSVLPRELGAELEARCFGCLATAATATWDVELPGVAGVRTWRLAVVPVAESDRHPARVFATLVDVSGLVRERHELQRRDLMMRHALDAIDQGVAVWDQSELLIHCNARYAQHHPGIADALTPGAGYRALLWEDAAGRRPRADGLHIETSTHAGGAGELITVSTDVTVRAAAFRAAERSSRALSAMFSAMDGAGLWLTSSGRVVALNSAAAEWLGTAPDDAVGRPLLSMLDPETGGPLAPRLDAVMAGGEAAAVLSCRDGRSLTITICAIPGADGRAAGAVLSVRDTSELDAATTRARDCEQALARAMRIASLGEMAGGLAHEVSQPIAAVVNYCRGAINRLKSGDTADMTAVVDALEEACREAERASAIMRNITGMIRRSPGSMSATDINAVARSVCERLQKDARKRRVVLALDLAEDLPHPPANAVEVEQVLTNLVNNAIDAAAAATGSERRATVRSAPAGDAAIEISVTDTGIGFADDAAAEAFTPFFTTKAGGIGMGLPICRAIVEGHGGRISAGNDAAGGAVVRFTLPLSAG